MHCMDIAFILHWTVIKATTNSALVSQSTLATLLCPYHIFYQIFLFLNKLYSYFFCEQNPRVNSCLISTGVSQRQLSCDIIDLHNETSFWMIDFLKLMETCNITVDVNTSYFQRGKVTVGLDWGFYWLVSKGLHEKFWYKRNICRCRPMVTYCSHQVTYRDSGPWRIITPSWRLLPLERTNITDIEGINSCRIPLTHTWVKSDCCE